MFDVPLLLDGDDASAASGLTFERTNPLSGAVASRAAAATVEDAARAAATAAGAFPKWSRLGPSARRAALFRAADLIEQRTDLFIAAMAEETGATAGWSQLNVSLAASFLREAASLTTRIGGEVVPSDHKGMISLAVRQPVGVVAAIAPWNAPVVLGVRAIAMPLACGNTVVFKTSELCPHTHRLIGDVMRDADLGDGVVNVIANAPADAERVVEALIAHPAVRRVNFTGSTRVGRRIAELAARHLKPALLELGGKAPFVVLDDADLEEASRAAAYSAFMNQGQICMSTERLIVDEAVADRFAELFARQVATLVAGDPASGTAPLGPVIGHEAAERVRALVSDAVSKGARVIVGGRAEGTLVDAVAVDFVTPSMRIYAEETFGPVVAMVRVRGVEEAVRVANDTEYGLASAVFGQDIMRAMEVARRIEAGICHINSATVHDEAQMPFGGVKASGYGRFGGSAAIDEFVELRWITIATRPGDYSI